MTTTVLNRKISEVENKISDNFKYIIAQEFNKLAAEDFARKLKEADLVNKTDFDNKLTRFNRKIASNKTKHLEVQKKLDSLLTKDYNFLLDRIYFTRNYVSQNQNMFVYKPIFNVLELEKDKGTKYIISWKSK